MAATLDAIDQDLPRMITNANAWATGDLARLSFDQLRRREHACADVFSNNAITHKYGIPNLDMSASNRFMDAATHALRSNESTVAIVSISSLLGPNGLAARLRAAGYTVESP